MSEEGIPIGKREENLDDKIVGAENKISELRKEIKEARKKKSIEQKPVKETTHGKSDRLHNFLFIIGILNLLLLLLLAINIVNPEINLTKYSFTGRTVEITENETEVVEENNTVVNETEEEPEEVLGIDMDRLEQNNILEPNRAYVYANILYLSSEGYVNLSIKFNDDIPEFPNFLGDNETVIAYPPSGELLKKGQSIFCKMKLLSDGIDSVWRILDIEG